MKLREYRKQNNMSQQTLADKLGLDVTTISKYENGSIVPSLPNMLKIKKVTGSDVDVEDFYNVSN